MRGFASRDGLDSYEVSAHNIPPHVSLLVASASATDSSSAEILFDNELLFRAFIERLRGACDEVFGISLKPEEAYASLTGITKSLSGEEEA